MSIFVTGGAGFIGSQFIRSWMKRHPEERVINFDKLTYAGNLENLREESQRANYEMIRGDVAEFDDVEQALPQDCDAVVHFAAESHVDRSILSAAEFIRTNVLGTQVLLDVARRKRARRFLHISTDEVGGSMEPDEFFHEGSPLKPSSPYAASKAGAEHLVTAAVHTFGVDAIITRTSNNYGAYQFPEKLLPLAISNALEHKPIPVYGDGLQVRDWIHVEDNVNALVAVLERGRPGETYHIGGGNPLTNIDVLRHLLRVLDRPESLLTSVTDRLGHDRRYAVDCSKIQRELGWSPQVQFDEGLEQTVKWYRENDEWVRNARSGAYRDYYDQMYGERLTRG
jgi:dTDP-glucose 4,6-dehydratase